jgi:hypothetical protein
LTTPPHPWRVAYLILSHQRPEQVEALTDRILALSPAGQVVVHHDAAATGTPWSGSPPDRAHLTERTKVLWGDWSIVEASRLLLRFAAEQLRADWFVLLSGEDRPVLDLAGWELDMQAAGLDGLVPARVVDQKPSFGRRPSAGDVNFVRYSYRWRELPAWRGPARTAVEVARRVSRYSQPLFKIEYTKRRDRFYLALPRRHDHPHHWTLYTGPQWLALGSRAVERVLEADEEVVDWYRQTWIPDQAFFHTVLHNQPDLALSDRPLTYVVPHATKQQRGDMVLRLEDLGAIRDSGAAFARKFDAAVDPDIVRAVDAAIDQTDPGW